MGVAGNWRRVAACEGTKVPFHYGQPGYNPVACKELCSGCPVRQSCLDMAMTYEAVHKGHYRFGIWGGLTATERDHLQLTDPRYAVYPDADEMSELEVLTIFTEVTSDMRVQFNHAVNQFASGEVVDLNDELTARYVDNGHATVLDDRPIAVEPVTEADDPAEQVEEAVARKAPAKKASRARKS